MTLRTPFAAYGWFTAAQPPQPLRPTRPWAELEVPHLWPQRNAVFAYYQHQIGDHFSTQGMRSNNRRRLERNRKFVDSPLEGDGFELSVPRENGHSLEPSSLLYLSETVRILQRSPSAGGVRTANSFDIEPVPLHVANTKELNSRPIVSSGLHSPRGRSCTEGSTSSYPRAAARSPATCSGSGLLASS